MAIRKIKRHPNDNIKTHADGTFWVQVSKYFGGKNWTRQKYGMTTKGEARRVRDELDEELYQLAIKAESGVLNWNEALEEYLLHCQKTQAASTFYSKDKILRADTREWTELAIDSIVPELVEKRILEATVGKSVDSKINLLKFIRGAFDHQVFKGKLSSNPCSRLATIKKPPQKKLMAMTREEIRKLLLEAKKMSHPWYPIYFVMYQLGLRSGEGLALTWSDIDFHNRSIVISKSYCSKSKMIKAPKNGEPRTIEINQETKLFLENLKKVNQNSEHVLPQLSQWLRGEAAKVLRSFQKDIGLKETNFHSLRASYITHLLLSGQPVVKVQYLVGHKDLKTTMRYVRISASDMKGSTDALALDLND